MSPPQRNEPMGISPSILSRSERCADMLPFGRFRSLDVVVIGLAKCGATKARAGRPQRANPAVGPWGTDFPGLSASGARRPFSSVRCAHCAQRRRVSFRSSLRSPPPNHASPAPPTRAAACPPAPSRTCGALRRVHATAVRLCERGVPCAEPHATASAGERLGVRARRAVGGGEDRRPGGGERSELRQTDSPALCAVSAANGAKWTARPRAEDRNGVGPPGADRRTRPAVPAPRDDRALSTPQVHTVSRSNADAGTPHANRGATFRSMRFHSVNQTDDP
jgi:hypothetical protein